MNQYISIAENPESTVVAEYVSTRKENQEYQSEAELEQEFIQILQSLAYEYLPLTTEQELIANLRTQLEKLNNYTFTDAEWNQFFTGIIANQSKGIEEKTAMIQEDHIQILHRDTGEDKNIYLIDKNNIHNNTLQVINQYETDKGKHLNRYDVTILINGLPLIHIELKRRGIDLKEAFNQIQRYQRESFWSGCGLFEYIQIFVISNGTYTKYYSNTTRNTHVKEHGTTMIRKGKQTSNSFEFTSWWADAKNTPITDMIDFAKTFFAKHTILNIITKYCIFNTDRLLLVMRPYQIVATERILNKIEIATTYKLYGKKEAGGYIWHTTGSGKTLTSFKTAQQASKLPYISKVLFVVDRKDLDYQTMKEYDKFEKGSANSNTNTKKLKEQLENPHAKIIITTIQKLSIFIKQQQNHSIFEQPIVLIFDECHRSQFGDMRSLITKSFTKHYIFGFTGTPIFPKNANSGAQGILRTTEDIFGEVLHVYTIVNAISDKNVLPFRVDYVGTMRAEENIQDERIYNINTEKALASPYRIERIVTYILNHFDKKTKRNEHYQVKEKRLAGFNSIFAVSSISMVQAYYREFKKQMSLLPSDRQLKIAIIYSYNMNEDTHDGFLTDENVDDTSKLDASSRDFLEGAIKDYNAMFNSNYSTSSDSFQNYYKDLSQKVKEREIDILIVANMFLTGFDATTLNTLWVDKNLRYHGLLQAYSRTNRILNSVKTHGNIVSFRNLEPATNQAFSLFSSQQGSDVALLKPYHYYYYGHQDEKESVPGYVDIVRTLQEKFPLDTPITTEEAQKEFVKLYSSFLKAKNLLTTFDEFDGNEILSKRDEQDYQSIYLDLHQSFRNKDVREAEYINDDLVFEIELIKQVEINIDYILMLIQKYKESEMKDNETYITIQKSVNSSLELRSKKDLIDQFILSLTPQSDIDSNWALFIQEQKRNELNAIIEEEQLKKEPTYKFMQQAFENGYVQHNGDEVTKILSQVNRFSKDNTTKKRIPVLDKLTAFFHKYRTISNKELQL